MCVSFCFGTSSTEYDALSRLGIEDPRGYIMQRYSTSGSSNDELVQLSTCCVGKAVVSRVEGAVEELLGSGNWLDAMVRNYLYIYLMFIHYTYMYMFA